MTEILVKHCLTCGKRFTHRDTKCSKKAFAEKVRFCSLTCYGAFRKTPFEECYVVNPQTGCWDWMLSKTAAGYGSYRVARGSGGCRPAHRYVYELYKGPIPDGLHIDHLCRNRACVNPDHLEPVTPAENQARGLRGRLKTHCVHGHPWTTENTFVTNKQGRIGRQCRICRRRHLREYKIRKKEAAANA